MLEDVKIIELFFARTEQAIAELAAKYGSTCKRIANNILKCEPDAEECVNDTYLAAWNAIPPERPDPLRTYIFRITRNIATAKYHANTALKRNSYYDVALDELEECHIHFLPAYLVLVLFLPSVSLCSLKLGSGKAPFLTVTAAEIFLLRFVLPFAAFIKRAHRQENVGMWIMTRWIRIVDCQIGAHPVCDKLVLYEVRQQRLPLL